MAAPFALARGRRARFTRTGTNGCCEVPAAGAANAYVVTNGWISVDATPVIEDGDDIEVLNANGDTCIYDPGCPTHRGFDLTITLCEVCPELLTLLTGVRAELGPAVGTPAVAPIVGFRQQTGSEHMCNTTFAMELWSGIPGGQQCTTDGDPLLGYSLFQCIENAVISGGIQYSTDAITLEITANTKYGATNAGWGSGPYNVVETNAAGAAGPLPVPMAADEPLLLRTTKIPAPTVSDGCSLRNFPATLPFAGNG